MNYPYHIFNPFNLDIKAEWFSIKFNKYSAIDITVKSKNMKTQIKELLKI
jgi:hypothetical protein